MKELEINQNYGGAFGLNTAGGQKAIYQGNDNWLLVEGSNRSKIVVSADTTKKALAYINQSSVMMG